MELRLVHLLALQLLFSPLIAGQTYEYFFDNDLENLSTQLGYWEYKDRASLNWLVPAGSDGFAVQSKVGTGDVLFDPLVNLDYGLTYTIRFFVASESYGTTKFSLVQLEDVNSVVETLEDWTSLSGPDNYGWFTMSGTIPPSEVPSKLGIYCQVIKQNSPNGMLYGCAVDYMKFEVSNPPINTTDVPEPTTAEPEPTTEESESTTDNSEPTTGEPNVTTNEPVVTTDEPVVTTEEPKDYTLDYTFESGTQGWILGRSNGAIWRRIYSNTSIDGYSGEYALQVYPVDMHSGTVLATSPRMVVGPTGSITLTVRFFLKASTDYPVFLKIRRRISFTTYDAEPAINLDTFGDQYNAHWLTFTDTYSGLTPDEEFNLVLEGGLGMLNYENSIVVSRVLVEGAAETGYDEQTFFDFTDGLVGWQSGCNDGGKWEAVDYDSVDPNLNVPEPSSGRLLMVKRHDIYSGIITIESPPITISPMTAKELVMRFWIFGSVQYPVHFRVGLKTLDGEYTTPPFFDFSQYGDSMNNNWIGLESSEPIPADPKEEFFQLVLEVDLGANVANNIAIDSINITTTSRNPEEFNSITEVIGYSKKPEINKNEKKSQFATHSLTPIDESSSRSTLEYTFTDNTRGWVLGRSNGGVWQRNMSDYDVEVLGGLSHVLRVFPVDIYSGTVQAMSPRLTIGSTGTISITMDFYMDGSEDYPTFLKLRRRLSFSEYDEEALINLDSYGNHFNAAWLSVSVTWTNLQVGQEFNLVLEGGLGSLNQEHSVAVSRILIEGAEEIPYDEDTFFDFEDGLVGWQSGSNDGGKWISKLYADVDSSLGMPPPSSGNVLMVERLDIHSGIITIESPPIEISPMTAKQMQARFWIKGSPVYPVSLRVGLKTIDGSYDSLPFLDLTEYGNSDSQNWLQLERYVPIPADPKSDFFQLVIEVDMGGDIENEIAIDSIDVRQVYP